MTGQIYGTAGAGVATGSWVANAGVARAGQRGEKLTARILDQLARDTDATVLHDLRIPLPRITANIDHAVVSGRTVWLIDSKMWSPGFLWTFAGRTRRGWRAFPSADKQTMRMARDAVSRYLRGSRAQIRKPIVAVWSTNGKPLHLWALRVPAAIAVNATDLPRHLSGLGAPGDPQIVHQLGRLLVLGEN